MRTEYETFNKQVIAQDDDNDYSESGFVAWIDNGVAHLARYSHCSCFGTLTSIGDDTRGDWSGTPDELVTLAQQRLDPDMPTRPANTEDYDYDHLMKVYEQIIEWDSNGRKA